MKRYVKEFANDRKMQLKANDLLPDDIRKKRINAIDCAVAMCQLGQISELEAVKLIAIEYRDEYRREV